MNRYQLLTDNPLPISNYECTYNYSNTVYVNESFTRPIIHGIHARRKLLNKTNIRETSSYRLFSLREKTSKENKAIKK